MQQLKNLTVNEITLNASVAT